MVMFEGRTTPEGIIELIMAEIDRLGGLEKAFPHEGRIQLYSGPNLEYFAHLIGADIENEARSETQAKEWNAKRLDDTPIGNFIFVKNKLYEWLGEVHRKSIDQDRLVRRDAKKVTEFVSGLFIKTASGDVQTCVCGASRDRVFCETEMHGLCDRSRFPVEAEVLVAALLANKDIETINGVSIDRYRKIYTTENYERVYRAICLAELRQRLRKAKKEKDADIYADYLDRRELYHYDQIYMNSPISNRLVYQKVLHGKAIREAEKQEKIEKFKAACAVPATPKSSVLRGRKSFNPVLG